MLGRIFNSVKGIKPTAPVGIHGFKPAKTDLSIVTQGGDPDVDHNDNLMSEKWVHAYNPAAIQYNPFNEDPEMPIQKRLVGPFGTINEPTMVFSPKPYRIVGCNGPHERTHMTGWMVLEGYLKHMCPTCGQIFQLTNNAEEIDLRFLEKGDHDAHIV